MQNTEDPFTNLVEDTKERIRNTKSEKAEHQMVDSRNEKLHDAPHLEPGKVVIMESNYDGDNESLENDEFPPEIIEGREMEDYEGREHRERREDEAWEREREAREKENQEREHFNHLFSKLEEAKKILQQKEEEHRSLERELRKLQEQYHLSQRLLNIPRLPNFRQKFPLGVVGLQNLGNSCYLNSAFQCLAKAPRIKEYFLDKTYLAHINESNRLGSGGELARTFGEFIHLLYSGKYANLSPRTQIFYIGKHCSHFGDFSQQDSAEFIQYVLDGLHEDLNQGRQGNHSIENKDSDLKTKKQPDESQLAAQAWNRHKERNNSIFVDVVQGQYRSSLTCAHCKKGTVTFDPFFNLTLPIPHDIRVSFLHLGHPDERPVSIIVEMKSDSKFENLRKEAAEELKMHNINADSLIFTDWRGYIFPDSMTIQPGQKIFSTEVQDYCRGDGKCEYLVIQFEDLRHFVVCRVNEGIEPKRINEICEEYLSALLTHRIDSETDEENEFMKEGSDASDIYGEAKPEGITIASRRKDYMKHTHTSAYLSRLYRVGEVTRVSQDCLRCEVRVNMKDTHYWKMDAMNRFNGPPPFVETIPKKNLTIYDCLEIFSKEESISEDWKCPNCQKTGERLKKTDIWRLPEILIIQLNRFQANDYTRTKISDQVYFPIKNLNMSQYTTNNKQQCNYDLFAISNHYGNLQSGHYTTCAKIETEKGDCWHRYDDTHVTEIDPNEVEQQVVTPGAYILFYQLGQKKSKEKLKKEKKKWIERIRSDTPNVTSLKLVTLAGQPYRMRCSPTTTMKELKTFIEKEMQFQSNTYVVYGKNGLIDISDSEGIIHNRIDVTSPLTVIPNFHS